MADPDFVDAPARSENRDRLNGLIAEVIAEKTTATWVEDFNGLGVPCGPIYNIGEMFADEQVEHLGLAQPLTSPELGEMKFVRQPFSLTRTPSSFAVAPPKLGEQTREILESLGYGPDDIAAMHENGVVSSGD